MSEQQQHSDARLAAVTKQRNDAHDFIAYLNGEIAVLKAKLEAAEKAVKDAILPTPASDMERPAQ